MIKLFDFVRMTTAGLVLRGLLLSSMTGCITTTDQRVNAFMRSSSSFIGKPIAEFEKYVSNAVHIGIKPLSNGNLEKEYASQWRWKYEYSDGMKKVVLLCHYFYEYESLSGLIVKFRIEEKVKDACQIPGV